MKVLSSTFLLAVMAVSTQALAVDLNKPVNGVWSVTDRICSDLVSIHPANDRFQLGRDSMTIEIKDNHGSVETIIEGVSYYKGFYVDQDRSFFCGELQRNGRGGFEVSFPGKINYKFDPNYENPKAPTDYNKLILMSGDFGKNGSCLPNETLFTILKRVK